MQRGIEEKSFEKRINDIEIDDLRDASKRLSYGEWLAIQAEEVKDFLKTLDAKQECNPYFVYKYSLKKDPISQFTPADFKDECHDGVIHLKGIRYFEQQDAHIKDEVAGFTQLTNQEQKEVLLKTCAEMQEIYGNEKDMGSTACITIECGAYYWNLNLGDSAFYSVSSDCKDSMVGNKINKIHNKRLGGLLSGIAMDHSFGDTAYEKLGLSHIPDLIYQKRNKVDDEKTVLFHIMTCDGFNERMGLNEAKKKQVDADKLEAAEVARCVQQFHHTSEDEVAFRLAEMALAGKNSAGVVAHESSTDNISIVVKQLPEAAAKGILLKDAIVLGIFDGHGGDKVSKNIAKNFVPQLAKNIQLTLEKRQQQTDALLQVCERYRLAITTQVMALIKKECSEKKIDSYKKFYRASDVALNAILHDEKAAVPSAGDIFEEAKREPNKYEKIRELIKKDLDFINGLLGSFFSNDPNVRKLLLLYNYMQLLSSSKNIEKIDVFKEKVKHDFDNPPKVGISRLLEFFKSPVDASQISFIDDVTSILAVTSHPVQAADIPQQKAVLR